MTTAEARTLRPGDEVVLLENFYHTHGAGAHDCIPGTAHRVIELIEISTKLLVVVDEASSVGFIPSEIRLFRRRP